MTDEHHAAGASPATQHASLTQALIVGHDDFEGGYRLLELEAPEVAAAVKPGQFVHVRIPGLDAALRRPFSIYRADDKRLSILYKQVGKGTAVLAGCPAGTRLSLLGPLGNGFPPCPADRLPVLIAGGYGVAPLALLAQRLQRTGVLFVGGQTARDILCVEDFRRLGWEVHLATDDGSLGTRGWVTVALDAWIAARAADRDPPPECYACGPDGLLKAAGQRTSANGWNGWLSLDKHMGCGYGACLACVQRVRRPDGLTAWTRVCKEGPVFEARDIVWA